MKTRRRDVLAGGGLLLGFVLMGDAGATAASASSGLPGDLAAHADLDAWLRIDAEGAITLLTGKVELGQGVLTAFAQLCAEELEVPIQHIGIISGDTALVPNEGGTVGSGSITYGGVAVRQASAEVRAILIELAAARWGIATAGLQTSDGAVRDPAGGNRLSYGELVGGRPITRRASGLVSVHTGTERKIAGRPIPRIDLPARVAGAEAFLHDLRLPRMLHARVIREPSARLLGFDEALVSAMLGVVAIVRDGSFLAVVAEDEWQAICAGAALADSARWEKSVTQPTDTAGISAWLLAAPADVYDIADVPRVDKRAAIRRVTAQYTRPYHMHGSIGPSIAVAELQDGTLTVWTHSQTVFDTAKAIAELTGLPPARVRCRHMSGAGCYGHNGADDAAADAALIACKLPGRPIRLQWSRQMEHIHEPYGSAMVNRVEATLDAGGHVLDWSFDLWSTPHNTRPTGAAGNFLAGQALATPFTPTKPGRAPGPNYAADRNAIPYYNFAGVRVTTHLISQQPLRASSTRSLGAFANVFAIESFVDELAHQVGADPVAYRIDQLDDPRAREVLRRAAQRFGWAQGEGPKGHGQGVAFARYKNVAAYCAVMLEVFVDRASGVVYVKRAVVAVDAGEVVNPDGLANQIEGGLLQGLSWALKERVHFDRTRVLSEDWESYPILTLREAPAVSVVIVDQPGMPFLGAGEASQGPAGAALANAVAHACGARIRDMPLSPDAVRGALRTV